MNNSAHPFFESPPSLPHWPGVRLFFTNRLGGVSTHQYSSLNLGLHVSDQEERVVENRHRLLSALNLTSEKLWFLSQVHGNETIIAKDNTPVIPLKGDALVTSKPGLGLAILTADCAPVLFIDPKQRVVGAAHAGWRGALGGILERCLETMDSLGSPAAAISAVIGPCIRQPAFEVGHEVRALFCDQDENNSRFFLPNAASFADGIPRSPSRNLGEGKFLLDLSGYIRHRLAIRGLLPHHIYDIDLCTFHEERFFSHRRSTQRNETPCGRQVSGVLLLESN